VSEAGDVTDLSYAELATLTSRFANVLAQLGIRKGDRVVSLLGRQPEQYVTALGTLKHTAVFSPLFSSFGPEPIRERLRLSGARVLVTTPQLYARKVAQLRPDLPDLEHVLLVGGTPAPGTLDFAAAVAAASPDYAIPRPIRRTWPSCTSPAAPPASRRARCTCTRRSSRTMPRGPSRSTSMRATCSGAPPTPAG